MLLRWRELQRVQAEGQLGHLHAAHAAYAACNNKGGHKILVKLEAALRRAAQGPTAQKQSPKKNRARLAAALGPGTTS